MRRDNRDISPSILTTFQILEVHKCFLAFLGTKGEFFNKVCISRTREVNALATTDLFGKYKCQIDHHTNAVCCSSNTDVSFIWAYVMSQLKK